MSDDMNPILQHYVVLTEFLGNTLGPNYEVVLHDLTDMNRSIIAIANNHVSGREIGAPLTNVALSILKDKSYEKADYRVHNYGLSVNGKIIRSNTLFIKHEGKLIGMLCVNFDGSNFQDICDRLLSLCHPDRFVTSVLSLHSESDVTASALSAPETFRNSTEAVANDAIQRILEQKGVAAQRLTSEERMQIIAMLEADGIFLLKGAVKDVAEGLCCSQASVYRYLSQIKAEKQELAALDGEAVSG